jgi:hypothetical protein
MANDSDGPKKRGRPKGSGIDDTAMLLDILSLMDLDPGLTPTAAIKQSGASHPSDIRRLRDKVSAIQRGEIALPGWPLDADPSPRARNQTTAGAAQRAPNRQSAERPRSGAGTRARARLGIPSGPRAQNTSLIPGLPSAALTQPRTRPDASAHADQHAAILAQLKLVLDATATLTKLQRDLLASLTPDGDTDK